MDDLILRICFIGAVGSGKTRLAHFLTKNEVYIPYATLGVDFFQSTIKINDKNVKYSIWDTTGIYNLYTIIRSFFKLTCAFVVITDITDAKYYTSVIDWVDNIRIKEEYKDKPIFLFCNTRGKENEYKYRIDQLTCLAEKHNLIITISDINNKNDCIEVIKKISLYYINELNENLKEVNKDKRNDIIRNYARNGVIVRESYYKTDNKKISWFLKIKRYLQDKFV